MSIRIGKGWKVQDGKIVKAPRALSVSDRIRQRLSKKVQVKKKSPGGLDG